MRGKWRSINSVKKLVFMVLGEKKDFDFEFVENRIMGIIVENVEICFFFVIRFLIFFL